MLLTISYSEFQRERLPQYNRWNHVSVTIKNLLKSGVHGYENWSNLFNRFDHAYENWSNLFNRFD